MTDVEKHKQQLEALLAQVTAELSNLGVQESETGDWIATPEPIDTEADQNEAADRVEEWDERRAILAELENRFNNIKRALKKIEEGTYGICEISGEAIEEERLEANPAARTCTEHMDQEHTLPM